MLSNLSTNSDVSVSSLGLAGGALYDDDHLARPVKRFVAEYVRKHVSIYQDFFV